MNIYHRIFRIVTGLTPIYVGVRLMIFIVVMNKTMVIPTGLPYIGFMAMSMLFVLGGIVIVSGLKDK